MSISENIFELCSCVEYRLFSVKKYRQTPRDRNAPQRRTSYSGPHAPQQNNLVLQTKTVYFPSTRLFCHVGGDKKSHFRGTQWRWTRRDISRLDADTWNAITYTRLTFWLINVQLLMFKKWAFREMNTWQSRMTIFISSIKCWTSCMILVRKCS